MTRRSGARASRAQEAGGTPALQRSCRLCGCTDLDACMTDDGPCHWIEGDLCSACWCCREATISVGEGSLPHDLAVINTAVRDVRKQLTDFAVKARQLTKPGARVTIMLTFDVDRPEAA